MATIRETTESDLMPKAKPLAGRVALVTGGTRGIGAAISRRLGEQGATVAAGYHRNREAAERFCASISGSEISASIHQGNVGQGDDCERVVNEVLERHGRVDILVNNAGVLMDKSVLRMSHDDWYGVLSVNLSGAFLMSKAVLGHMVERGTGRIVSISAISGEQGRPGQANYAASAAGLFGFTKTLAREAAQALAKRGQLHNGGPGLTINCVAPGLIDTEMVANVRPQVLDALRARIPLGRFGTVEDVAYVVQFLCADQAAYVTGQVINVDGGLQM